MSKAFSLIECLILVALAGLVAAIAVPNYMEAQKRTQLGRAKSDLRILATALEAYTADHGQVPLDYNTLYDPPPAQAAAASGIFHPGYWNSATNALHAGLTTPVAYVANCWMQDPYAAGKSLAQIPFEEQVYTYQWLVRPGIWGRNISVGFSSRNYPEFYGAWRICSIGPDMTWYNSAPAGSSVRASRVYDPTNGTVSFGNIWRCPNYPQVTTRPPADLTADFEG